MAGEVIAVEILKDERPEDEREGPGPSVARVKVLEVLKGRTDAKEIPVGSGPIASCSGDDVHFSFKAGMKRIFILPRQYTLGGINLRFGGSMPGLEARPIVESRLLRVRAFRDEYLDALGRGDAAAHADGTKLAEEMRREAKGWTKLTWEQGRPAKGFEETEKSLVERLRKVRVEVIFAALALDWFGEETWWRHDLWEQAVQDVARERRDDLERAERARILGDLRRAKVTDGMADRYMNSLKTNNMNLQIDFPPRSDMSRDFPDPERLTTGFILRFHEYDRGGMFPAYGMNFDELAGLDAARVETLLPALYGSDDEQLRVVAFRAVERIPGTRFVELVMNRLMDVSWEWKALVHPTDAKETKSRLEALCDAAEKTFNRHGIVSFWDQLLAGKCFEDCVIERAIARLDSKNEKLIAALRAYLAGAMAARNPEENPALKPEEYRSWFRAHPR